MQGYWGNLLDQTWTFFLQIMDLLNEIEDIFSIIMAI